MLYLNFRFADSIVYYGLSLSVTDFGLDIYLTQLAFGAVELPARLCCIFLLEWFGRKKMQSFLLLLSGVICLILTGIPAGEPSQTVCRAGQSPGHPSPCSDPSSSWQNHGHSHGLSCLHCHSPGCFIPNILASPHLGFLLPPGCAGFFHSSWPLAGSVC